MRLLLSALMIASNLVYAAEKGHLVNSTVYSGMCDASAAVAVSSNLFVVASDEDNVLRLYQSDHAGPPVKSFNMDSFLELTGKSREADLEGAALIGHRAFWIGSHGRNKDGKARPNRCRLFATDVDVKGANVDLSPVGKPYKSLLDDLVRDPRFAQFHLDEAARLPPKHHDALNIEGLAATPQGHLLLGFRNPTPGGRALIIPLLNPNDLIEGKVPQFGPATLLDLDGLGVRDVAACNGGFLIVGGEAGSGGDFKLYRWDGAGEPKRIKAKHFDEYSPEAIIVYPAIGDNRIQFLSDDGTRPVDGVLCKEISSPDRQTFRSFWVSLK